MKYEGEFDILFKCDPEKNISCKKLSCGKGLCESTTDINSAAVNDEGRPVISAIGFKSNSINGVVEVSGGFYSINDKAGGR